MNTLLLGGTANASGGAIYEATVTRDAGGNITSIGPATPFATSPFIDGGLAFGPGGDLFFTEYPNNQSARSCRAARVPPIPPQTFPVSV
jgi:hypothetical protein